MEQLKTSSKRRSLEGGEEWGQDHLVTVSWNEVEPSSFQLPPPISSASTIKPNDYTKYRNAPSQLLQESCAILQMAQLMSREVDAHSKGYWDSWGGGSVSKVLILQA